MAEQPSTPWQRASTTKRSRRSEEQGAKLSGGKRQPASGALPHRKGDIRENGYLVDDKITDAGSYRVTREDWRKIEHEAAMSSLRPAMRITIAGLPPLRLMLEDDVLYHIARSANTD